MSQAEFGETSFEVMKHVFDIHHQIGRLFDESIYKQELARRMPDVQLEQQIDVVFESFRAEYFVDVIVSRGALFEFKAVEQFAQIHRAQLLNYLMLCDLAHGKLINIRTDFVEHEFVNMQRRRADFQQFKVDEDRWNSSICGAKDLMEYVVALMRDLGTGLELSLYVKAIECHLQAGQRFEEKLPVTLNESVIGHQSLQLMNPRVALRLTGLSRCLENVEVHLRRMLTFMDLDAIAWINIDIEQVTFVMLCR